MVEIVRIKPENIHLAEEAARLFLWNDSNRGQISKAFFENDSTIMYVALNQGNVVGHIYGYILERFETPKKQLFLYSIDVLEAYRKRGIGKGLISEFLQSVASDKLHNAFVLTNKGNIAAVNLYQSTGAKEAISDEGEDMLFKWLPQ